MKRYDYDGFGNCSFHPDGKSVDFREAEAAIKAAVLAERKRWTSPAFLWPKGMPDEVSRWISANPPDVVPGDRMVRVKIRARGKTTAPTE